MTKKKLSILFNSVPSFSCCCACCANEKTLQHMEHKRVNQSHLRYLLFQVGGAKEERRRTEQGEKSRRERRRGKQRHAAILVAVAIQN